MLSSGAFQQREECHAHWSACFPGATWTIERQTIDVVEAVKRAVRIPIAVTRLD